MEVEISNPQYRLKPGMYARVGIVTESHPNALVVPTNAVVDVNGTRGVYLSVNNVATFHAVKIGIEGNERTEILDGVAAGDRIVSTGAAGLRNGDPIVLAGGGGGRGGRGNRGAGARGSDGANSRGGDASASDPGQRSVEPGAAAGGGPATGEGRRGGLGGRRGQRTGGAAPNSQ